MSSSGSSSNPAMLSRPTRSARAASNTSSMRALASGHGAELGALALRTVLPRRRPAQVLRWLERTRAAALLASAVPEDEEGAAAGAGAAEAAAGPEGADGVTAAEGARSWPT